MHTTPSPSWNNVLHLSENSSTMPHFFSNSIFVLLTIYTQALVTPHHRFVQSPSKFENSWMFLYTAMAVHGIQNHLLVPSPPLFSSLIHWLREFCYDWRIFHWICVQTFPSLFPFRWVKLKISANQTQIFSNGSYFIVLYNVCIP